LFFGTISSSKQLDWVRMAWKKTQPSKNRVGLLIVGERVNWPLPPSEKAWLRTPGFLPPNQVSIAFQTSDLALLPFIDGASERRTSFMAALSHGLPVLTTAGASTGPTLRAASGFSICATVDAFVQATARLLADEPVRSRLGSTGRALYEANYSWTRLVEQLAPKLTLPLQNRQRSP
jgi:glycosyltransferase involved in cell wall biosynthesis